MSGFLYGVALQWKLDIRSKSLLSDYRRRCLKLMEVT